MLLGSRARWRSVSAGVVHRWRGDSKGEASIGSVVWRQPSLRLCFNVGGLYASAHRQETIGGGTE